MVKKYFFDFLAKLDNFKTNGKKIFFVIFDHPPPLCGGQKTLFLDFRVGKTHIGPKNNSKQLLRWWCYTHFFPFARKSRICDNRLSKNNFFHDLKFLNPTVLLCVILHQPIGHFSKKLRKKNSKTKITQKVKK